MNVLHINRADSAGGAGIAAYRLHQGLLQQKIASRLLVDRKQLDTPLSARIPRQRYLEKARAKLGYCLGCNDITLGSTGRLTRHPFYQAADILTFHNLHGDYFNYLAIPKLTRAKPAVWLLHDMWGFTGHCAYSFECDRWRQGCGHCPYLDTPPAIQRDNTALTWRLKRWVYQRSRLTIVTPSQWLTHLAQNSLLNRFPIHYIPNGLDLNTYQPLDTATCRAALGLPPTQKVLMFVAQDLSDPRKGMDLLITALNALPTSLKQTLTLLTLGSGGDALADRVEAAVLPLGYVGGDRLKAIAYAAADLFVFPTRADNLPIVLQESLACGTPMVSFAVGGVPELVRPGVTGLLARPKDPQDLADKLTILLKNDTQRQHMARRCREIALQEYSLEQQTRRYVALYTAVLRECHRQDPTIGP